MYERSRKVIQLVNGPFQSQFQTLFSCIYALLPSLLFFYIQIGWLGASQAVQWLKTLHFQCIREVVIKELRPHILHGMVKKSNRLSDSVLQDTIVINIYPPAGLFLDTYSDCRGTGGRWERELEQPIRNQLITCHLPRTVVTGGSSMASKWLGTVTLFPEPLPFLTVACTSCHPQTCVFSLWGLF